jgi:hypothetical protein
VLGASQNRILRDVAAGTSGRRDCHARKGHGGKRISAADHLQIVEHVARLGGERRDGFGGIDNAAAAEPEHDIASGISRGFRAGPSDVDRRLTPDGKIAAGNASIGKQWIEPRVMTADRPTHDEYVLAKTSKNLPKAGAGASAEEDPTGRRKLEPRVHHQPASSG